MDESARTLDEKIIDNLCNRNFVINQSIVADSKFKLKTNSNSF